MNDPFVAFVIGMTIGCLVTFSLTVYVTNKVLVELQKRPYPLAESGSRAYPPITPKAP